ncbi:hypothetical protein EV127DRAFT_414731 [Xylaria flabelliformis]|nr:hypothetical protein EV127DRAFT_414731 [Xylaria flabelliformis]
MASTDFHIAEVSSDNPELSGAQDLPAIPPSMTHNDIAQNQHALIPEVYHEELGDRESTITMASEASYNETIIDPRRRLTIKESIGGYGLLVIIGGAIAVVAGLAFIIFLWTGRGSSPGAVDASLAWRAITLGGWTVQATTLAALLIRAAVAAQATVCTAMLASLFLERRSVPKSDVAQLSVLRAINDGPLKLMWLVLRSLSHLVCFESALVVSLVIGSLVLQFASTILFSDLQQLTIAANPASFPVNNYITEKVNHLYTSDVTEYPPTYAVFGELPYNASSDPDTNGFSATGPKTRGFIPLTEPSNRTAIHTYSGNAVSMLSSVACMRPNMQSSYTGVYSVLVGGGEYDFGRVTGTLNYGESLRTAHSIPDFCNSEDCATTNFNCSLPGMEEDSTGPGGSFCLVDIVGSFFSGGLGWDSATEPWSNNSFVYLMFSTNMYTTDWNMSHTLKSLEAAPKNEFGEWNSYQIQPSKYINVTLCFSAFHADLKSIDMTATGDLEEPQGSWSALGHGDSSKARKYLGVSEKNNTFADRGILTIEKIQEPKSLSPVASYDQPTKQSNWTLAKLTTSLYEEGAYDTLAGYWSADRSFQACTACQFVGNQQHLELCTLVQDIIRDTGRAADALQAYTTAVANTFYHDFLRTFDGAEEVQIAFTKTVQAAACQEYGCNGLITVASFIAFHLLYVALTTYIYVKLTQFSRQGNTWHTISQLMGSELQTTIEKANDMGDEALAAYIKREGNDTLMTLQKTDGGICVVKHIQESK